MSMAQGTGRALRPLTRILVPALLGLAVAAGAAAHESEQAPGTQQETGQMESMMGGGQGQGEMGHEMMPGMQRLMMPDMNPVRGRKLFASKGCVACHSINGVGGHDATALDAHTMDQMMNPFDLAAKMWMMAPAMIYAQEEALGEQILFTGDELADIIAFVHDDEEQHHFSEADITPEVEKMMHHAHGEPGAGAEAHGEEIGHMHGEGQANEQHND